MEIGVLVTGVGSGSTGEQVYRALRQGLRRYRIAVGNVEPARTLVAPDADARVELPPARAEGYLAALARAANAHGARFIAPGTDVELREIAARRAELARLTPAIPLVNGAATIRTCQDKALTAAALARAGFRAPSTFDLAGVEDALEAVARGDVGFPVVVKPRSRGGGSVDVYLAQDEAELRFVAELVLRGGNAILQEYVGDARDEYTVGVLHRPDGSLGGSFALRRDLSTPLSTRLRAPNRTGRAELGPELAISSGFSQGEVDDFAAARGAAERIAGAVGSTGPLNVQGRLVGGDLVVFEINPRFSGTEGIRAMAGWNAPEALIDWHLGFRSPLAGYRARRSFFVRTVTEVELGARREVEAPAVVDAATV
jgi:carbamoyl-phosphate synthase large subunit